MISRQMQLGQLTGSLSITFGSLIVSLDNDTLRVDRNEAYSFDRTRCRWAITQKSTSLRIQRMRYEYHIEATRRIGSGYSVRGCPWTRGGDLMHEL